jgi:hypothetical protein
MKQHRVRLGDVLDDFCPRCRLLMNHGVVGLVEGEVRKVRCLTCHFEHPYRHARSGRHQDRKKKEMQKLFHQVLKGKNEHRISNEVKHRPPVTGRRVRIARPEEPEPHERKHKPSDPPAATLPPAPKGKGKVAPWRKAWEEMQKKQQS